MNTYKYRKASQLTIKRRGELKIFTYAKKNSLNQLDMNTNKNLLIFSGKRQNDVKQVTPEARW